MALNNIRGCCAVGRSLQLEQTLSILCIFRFKQSPRPKYATDYDPAKNLRQQKNNSCRSPCVGRSHRLRSGNSWPAALNDSPGVGSAPAIFKPDEKMYGDGAIELSFMTCAVDCWSLDLSPGGRRCLTRVHDLWARRPPRERQAYPRVESYEDINMHECA